MKESEEIIHLQKRIADLKARMPKHSVNPSMLIELEEMEERLAEAQAQAEKAQEDE